MSKDLARARAGQWPSLHQVPFPRRELTGSLHRCHANQDAPMMRAHAHRTVAPNLDWNSNDVQELKQERRRLLKSEILTFTSTRVTSCLPSRLERPTRWLEAGLSSRTPARTFSAEYPPRQRVQRNKNFSGTARYKRLKFQPWGASETECHSLRIFDDAKRDVFHKECARIRFSLRPPW